MAKTLSVHIERQLCPAGRATSGRGREEGGTGNKPGGSGLAWVFMNMNAKVTSALPSVQYHRWVPACQAVQLVQRVQCRRVGRAYPFHLSRHVRPWCHCHRPVVPPIRVGLVLRAHPWVRPDRVLLCDPVSQR